MKTKLIAALKVCVLMAALPVLALSVVPEGAGARTQKSIPATSKSSQIVKMTKLKCTYVKATHTASASGYVTWTQPKGGGAQGTVHVNWTAKKLKASAISQQVFQGPWTVTSMMPKAPASCFAQGLFSTPTASSVFNALQAAGLPVSGLIVYNESSDPNELLGRQNGYLSKVAWQDNRIDQTNQSSDPGGVEWGGSIEVFSNKAEATTRAQYVSGFGPPLGDGYDYQLGPIFLRLSNSLLPSQAAAYAHVIGASPVMKAG